MKNQWVLLGGILLTPLSFAADSNSNGNTLPLPNDIPVTAPQQTEGSWSFGVSGGLDSTDVGNNNHNAARNTSSGADVTYALPNTSNDASLSYQRR